MSRHYYADTQHLLIIFILTAPLTPAHENTKLQVPHIIVTEHTFFMKFGMLITKSLLEILDIFAQVGMSEKHKS